MPQVLFVVIAGAGIYAGYRWAQGVVGRVEAFKDAMATEAARARAEAVGPRDLGSLEWDNDAKVYRPKSH